MKIISRIYKITDGELVQLADRVLNTATRDLPHLATQGLTQAEIDSIRADRDAFSNWPTDEELMGDLEEATENRNATLLLVKQKIVQVSSKARFKFGEQSVKYQHYGLNGVSRCKPRELVSAGRRTGNVAAMQLPDLADRGLTQAVIDDLNEHVALLKTQIYLQFEAIDLRREAMMERTELGNTLYRRIVILAAMGKLCWQYSSEAKYNDYLITDKHPDHTQAIAETIAAQSVVNHDLAGVAPHTKLKAQNTGLTDIRLYFATDPTLDTGPHSLILPAGGKLTFTASQIGYNEEQGLVFFNVFNCGTVRGGYKVRWG